MPIRLGRARSATEATQSERQRRVRSHGQREGAKSETKQKVARHWQGEEGNEGWVGGEIDSLVRAPAHPFTLQRSISSRTVCCGTLRPARRSWQIASLACTRTSNSRASEGRTCSTSGVFLYAQTRQVHVYGHMHMGD
eukprot:2088071-Pleurochrysis_carterae.AAC.4